MRQLRRNSSLPSLVREGHIPSPPLTMLWKYSLQFTGMIDAPASVVEARKTLMEKMKADPAAFISKLEPAEPTCQTLGAFAKQVIGLK